jgi:hypothetical protein
MNELVSNPPNPQAISASRRRSRLVSSWAALLHIRSAICSKELKIRHIDRVSDVMLICGIVYAIAVLLFPALASSWLGVADLAFGITFYFYITQRLGIITTFSVRQTVLIAELLFCMTLLGMYIAINIGAIYPWLRFVGL